MVVEGIALWSTVDIWGHPEDVVALGFAVYALIFLLDHRWTGAGWFLGIAIAMQLYVVVLVPIVIALIGWRKATEVLARSAIIPGFFLVAVLVPNFHGSLTALLNQPNFPKANFPTPWVLLAPKLSSVTVAAGPGRIIGLAVAVALAIPAYRWRANPAAIVWLAGVVLGHGPVLRHAGLGLSPRRRCHQGTRPMASHLCRWVGTESDALSTHQHVGVLVRNDWPHGSHVHPGMATIRLRVANSEGAT
jgi:hypothetical protein